MTLGGDPLRIAVVGESAGGNLAINVSMMARDHNIAMPLHQVLIYPVAGVDPSPLRGGIIFFTHHQAIRSRVRRPEGRPVS